MRTPRRRRTLESKLPGLYCPANVVVGEMLEKIQEVRSSRPHQQIPINSRCSVTWPLIVLLVAVGVPSAAVAVFLAACLYT